MLAARTAVLARPASSRQPTCSSRRFPAFQPARVAPSAARKQQVVVCAAAAVEEAVVKAESSAPKMGVAHLRYGKGSVFKVRRLLDVIRGKSYEDALVLMEYMPYRACEPILKVLMSAAANAKNNAGALKSKLYVAETFADEGPTSKRFMPRAQGRAYQIMKRSFHLTIKVQERSD